jgi:hypothetical protein
MKSADTGIQAGEVATRADGAAMALAAHPAIAHLPTRLRDALAEIGAAGRGPFGNASTQHIFDTALPALEALYEIGAEHRDVADILAELGITDDRGRRLSMGTVSSAVYRARLKRSSIDAGKEHPAATARPGIKAAHFWNPPVVPEGMIREPSAPALDPQPATMARNDRRPSSPARVPPDGGLSVRTASHLLNSIRTHDD